MTLENWLTDVSSVWQWVLDIIGYFNKVEQRVVQKKTDKYIRADISAAIQQYWEHQWKSTVLKFVKLKAFQSVFAIGVTFDSKKVSNIGDSNIVPITITKKS